MKRQVVLMELPKKLGIPQVVEFDYDSSRRGYEGILMAEGCRRGICVRYRASVRSKNGIDWESAKPTRNRLELGGCLRHQAVADALLELSSKYEVGIWYEYRRRCVVFTYLCPDNDLVMEDCGVVVNGIKLKPPYCRTVEDCVEKILSDYRRVVEGLKEPPLEASRDAAEKLLQEYPELEAFGVEWVREWLIYARERMIQIANILRNHPRTKEIVEKTGLKENPHLIEIYIAKDATEECVAVGVDVYCLSSDKIRKMPLDYIGLVAPRGLMAFAKRKEFVRVV